MNLILTHYRASKDGFGKPVLTASQPTPQITLAKEGKDENDPAKGIALLAKIIGKFLDNIIPGLSFNFFENLFDDLLNPRLPNRPNPTAAFHAMASTINTSFLLPAGNVFFFRVSKIKPRLGTLANLW